MILARRVELWEWISCARHSKSFVRRDDIFFFFHCCYFLQWREGFRIKEGLFMIKRMNWNFVLFGLGAPSTWGILYIILFFQRHLAEETCLIFLTFLFNNCFLTESYNWSLPAYHNSSGTLWVYGDSLGLFFHQAISSRPLCKRLYSKCKNSYNWLYPRIDGKTEKDLDLDFRPEKVLNAIRDVLHTTDLQQPSSVLLLNLGLHYPYSLNFTTFQKALGMVINLLKETKYKAKVIWKSTTAIFKHKGTKFNPTDKRFLTPQVSAYFSVMITLDW